MTYTMIEYRPGRFTLVHDRYPQVWQTLNDANVVARMKILSRRGVPAVSALDIDAERLWNVLEQARRSAEEVQVKQMVGHQTRQIMESVGYQKIGSKPIRTSWIFTSGAVYRHPEWNRLYIHRIKESDGPDVFCIANKKRLTSLAKTPPQIARWILYRTFYTRRELNFVLNANLDNDLGWTWKKLCRAIEIDGYVILRF